jgi:hypothetical protein
LEIPRDRGHPPRFTKKDYTRLKKIFAAVWENFELAL